MDKNQREIKISLYIMSLFLIAL